VANITLEDPALWGVDEIFLVDDFSGRYVSEVTVPGTFVWNEPRRRQVELPTFKWRIGDRWFGAVVPIDFDDKGNEEPLCVSLRLKRYIDESKSDLHKSTG
jgi:hypothetical protein